VHRAHGSTPFDLLHGYSPSSAYILFIPSLESQAPQKANRVVDSFRRYHAQCMMQARARLEQDAERRKLARMPASHRLPRFSVGDHVCLSVAHLSTDSLDSKLSPRFLGPFKIIASPYPYVYHLDLGYKFPHVHPLVCADVIKPFVHPCACVLRKGEVDFPVIGDASRTY
jgi:hypothetical protein